MDLESNLKNGKPLEYSNTNDTHDQVILPRLARVGQICRFNNDFSCMVWCIVFQI